MSHSSDDRFSKQLVQRQNVQHPSVVRTLMASLENDDLRWLLPRSAAVKLTRLESYGGQEPLVNSEIHKGGYFKHNYVVLQQDVAV